MGLGFGLGSGLGLGLGSGIGFGPGQRAVKSKGAEPKSSLITSCARGRVRVDHLLR